MLFRLLHVRLDLFSRAVARQVSSALHSLTSVFGMGTGVPCTLKRRTIHLLCADMFHTLEGRSALPELHLRGMVSDYRCLHPTFGHGHCPLVGSSGLEPPTSRLSGARSNLLSYEPVFRYVSSLSVELLSAATRGPWTRPVLSEPRLES